jgi:hypothetical protein
MKLSNEMQKNYASIKENAGFAVVITYHAQTENRKCNTYVSDLTWLTTLKFFFF